MYGIRWKDFSDCHQNCVLGLAVFSLFFQTVKCLKVLQGLGLLSHSKEAEGATLHMHNEEGVEEQAILFSQ